MMEIYLILHNIHTNFVIPKQYYNMQSNNSQSLLSQLSNVSYRQPKKMYSGSQFFRESLPPGYDCKTPKIQKNEQQVDIELLGNSSAFKCYNPAKEYIKVDTLYWASDHNVEGTSENQEELLKIQAKQPLEGVKEQYMNQNVREEANYDDQNYAQSQIQSSRLKSNQQQCQSEISEKGANKIKNQTKNIPKNFGKAIIIFIEKNPKLLFPILEAHGVSHHNLMHRLRNLKKKINTIADLRNLWASQPESQCLRVISNLFLRKHSLHYIYNSRIKTRICHAKYKKRLQQAIVDPFEFNHIKQY